MSVCTIRARRRAAGVCVMCGDESDGRSRCPRHAAMNRAAADTRYARDKARQLARIEAKRNHAAAMAKVWGQSRAVEPPSGANPTKCAPFKPHAVDNTRRTDCARARECRDYAIARNWSAFSCEGCAVRETAARDELATRCGGNESQPWPQIAGR